MSLRLAIKASLQDLAPPVPPPAPAQPPSSSSSVSGPPPSKSKKDSPHHKPSKGSKSSNASLADSSVSGASTQGHDKKPKKEKKERRDKEGDSVSHKDKKKKHKKKDKEDKDKKRKRKDRDKESKEEKERRKKKKKEGHKHVKQEDGVVKGEEEEEELIITSEEEGDTKGTQSMQLQDSDDEQVEDSDDVLESSSSSSEEEEEEEEEDETLGRVDTPPVDMMKRSVKAVVARKGPQSLLHRRVRVQFAGGWYGGSITKVNEEKRSCRIAYDDNTRGSCRLDAKDVIVEPLLPGQRLEAKKSSDHKPTTVHKDKDTHKEKDKEKDKEKEKDKDSHKPPKDKEKERAKDKESHKDKEREKEKERSKKEGSSSKSKDKDKDRDKEASSKGEGGGEKKKGLLVKEKSGGSIASTHSKTKTSKDKEGHKGEGKDKAPKSDTKDRDKDKERERDKGEKRPLKPPSVKPPVPPAPSVPVPSSSSSVLSGTKKPRRDTEEDPDKTTPKESVVMPAPAPPTASTKPEEEGPLSPPPPTPEALPPTVAMDVDGVEAKAMVVEGPQKKKTEWVQCEDCDKWRKCPLDIVHTLPEQWYCHMNDWDPAFNTCQVPQEEDDDPHHHDEEDEEEEDGEGQRGLNNAMDFIRASAEGGGGRGYGRGRGRGRRGYSRGRRGGFGGGYYRSEDQWVQCDGCAKWRRVPRSVDAQALPNKWFCSMATWGRALTCTVPAAGDNDQASVNSQSSRPQRSIRIPGGVPPPQQGNVPNTPGSSGSRRTSRGDHQQQPQDWPPVSSSLPTSPTPRRSTSAYSPYMQQQAGGGQAAPSGTPAAVVQVDWVQCEGCKKWRKLPAHVKVDSLPDVWFCRMNQQWDPNHASCDVAEEPYNPTPDPQAHPTATPTTGGGKGGRGGSILGGGGGRQGKALSWRDIIFGSDGRVKSYFSDRGMNASVTTAIFDASPLFPINPYVLPPPRHPPPNMPPLPSTRDFGPFALSTHYQPPTTIRSSLTNRTIPAPQPPPLPFLPVPTLAWRMYYRERKEAQQHDALHTQIDSYRRSGMIRSMVGAVLREATTTGVLEGKAKDASGGASATSATASASVTKGLTTKQVTSILRRRRFDAESEGCYLWEGLRQEVVGSSSSKPLPTAPQPPSSTAPLMPPPAAPATEGTGEVAAIASALTELVSMGRARVGDDETYVWTGGEGEEDDEDATPANHTAPGGEAKDDTPAQAQAPAPVPGEGSENVPAPSTNGESSAPVVASAPRQPITKVRSKDLAGKPFKACKPWKAH